MDTTHTAHTLRSGTCACGESEPHRVARRRLLDGKSVVLWSDGLVTGALGFKLRGIGSAREPWAREADLQAGWALFGEVELLNSEEVVPALKALRKAFRAPFHGRPGFKSPSAAHIRGVIFRA